MKKKFQVMSVLSVLLIIAIIPSAVMAIATPSVSYCTHVQNIGWGDYAAQGEMSGTTGMSYRLEGIRIALDEVGYDLGIEYQTHIQNIGWEADTDKGWSTSNGFSGTEGFSYRLEAIQIKLTGSDADQFDIFYQVHAQNVGWMGWAMNGESSGTAGFGYRLEGIRIVILPAGSDAPTVVTTPAFIDKNDQDQTIEPEDYTVYRTESGSKYHLDSCAYLSESKIPLLKSQAIELGLEPCSICNP